MNGSANVLANQSTKPTKNENMPLVFIPPVKESTPAKRPLIQSTTKKSSLLQSVNKVPIYKQKFITTAPIVAETKGHF